MPPESKCAHGNATATPGCGCAYCCAVFDEWGRNAEAFQRVYESGVLDRYLRRGAVK